MAVRGRPTVCARAASPCIRGVGTASGTTQFSLLPDRDLTMAELSLDEKNRISSRSKAVRAAVEVLDKLRDDRAFQEEV
ncbi:MAG TPA: non-canonical purine NTP pyrophosphatase [Dehalococcoidia bacterium]